MKIFIIAEIPDDLGNTLLQHIRDFDVRHHGLCKFNIFASAPDKSVDELREMLNIQPPLQHKVNIAKSLNVKMKDPGRL